MVEGFGGRIPADVLIPVLSPLLFALKAIHERGMIHRDLSPDNIMMLEDGSVCLIDFGNARDTNDDKSMTLAMKEGFAPPEQYRSRGQGPYTDVYGLCATLFRVFIGDVIPKATLRMENPSLAIPTRFAEELPRHVLAALANGLKVNPNDRTANIETFKNELVYGEIAEAVPEVKKNEVKSSSKVKEPKEKKTSGVKYIAASAGITAVVFLLLGAVLYFSLFKGNKKNDTPTESNVVVSVPEVEDTTNKYEDLPVKKYTVPDLTGKTYAEILEDEGNENFIFIIKDAKVYSSDYARGQICKQSVKKGTEVKKETKIELTISLGSKEFKMPNVVGLDEQTAKLELLKAGFLYENIKMLEKYDENSETEKILEQTPEYSKKVNADMVVSIYKNTYQGEDPIQGGDDQAILDEYASEIGTQN
jgi:hypothetical protein